MSKPFFRIINIIRYFARYAFSYPMKLLRLASSVNYMEAASMYPDYLKKGNGLAFCIEHAKLYCKGSGIDVGAGGWPFPGARPVENNVNEDAFNIREDDNSIDYVFSSHCLEHLENWQGALAEWIRVCRPDAIVYIYLPHPAAELWHKKNLPYHLWTPVPQTVIDHLVSLGCDIVDASYFPDVYFSFYVVARKGS